MKIAVNTRFLLPNKIEGLGRYTLETVQRLVQMHPEHTFFFFFDRPAAPEFLFAPNVVPVVLQPSARHPFLFVWWFEVAVANALEWYGCDVFLSTDCFLSLSTRTPTLLVLHDLAYWHRPHDISWLQLQYYRWFQPRFLRKAKHIFTVSEYVKQDVLAHITGLSPKNMTVTYNSSGQDRFSPLAPEEVAAVRASYTAGKPYFFYVGSVHPRKNLLRLLQAFEQFRTAHPAVDCELLVAGRLAWQTTELERFYETMQHRESVRLLGFVADSELPRLVAAAHALCYVSLFEGFGIPILEGMYAEVPVLTANVTSMPEVAGEAALLVSPTDVSAIADGLWQLWSDADLCQTLVARGRERRTHFSWQVSAQEISRVMQTFETVK